MKLYIAAGVVLAILGITESALNLTEVKSECSRETNVNKKDLITYINEIVKDGYASTNNNVSCYKACILIKGGEMTEGKSFDVHATERWYPNVSQKTMNAVHEVVESCSSGDNINIKEPCERAYHYVLCELRKNSTLYTHANPSFLPDD